MNKKMKKVRGPWHTETFSALCLTETSSECTMSNTFWCSTSPKSVSITLELRDSGKCMTLKQAQPRKKGETASFSKYTVGHEEACENHLQSLTLIFAICQKGIK